MSYILDALKKIEHEKNKKIHPGGRISISGDLFQERKRPTAKAYIWKVLALIAVASLVTCAGTWFFLQGKGEKRSAVIRPAALPPPPPVNSPAVTPVIPVPVQSQSTQAPVPPVLQRNSGAGAAEDSPARDVRRSKKQITLQPPSPPQSTQTVQAPADIKLSGIAWQDDRSARRAVVNGFLLKEGAVVSGATITDIQANRVRFSSAAGPFEIKLDAVLPAGGQR